MFNISPICLVGICLKYLLFLLFLGFYGQSYASSGVSVGELVVD